MQLKRVNFLLLLFLLTVMQSHGQSFLNSPYSRFGLGELYKGGFSQNRALGGITTGYRAQNSINYLNPASYTALDTLSFVFDFGVQGGWLSVQSNSGSNTTSMAYLDHLAMMFPVTHWWSSCLGIAPFSRKGYDLLGSVQDTSFNYIYTGNGGLSQFFIGNSLRIGEHVALGFNLSYIFGPLNRSARVSINKDAYAAYTLFDYNAHLGGLYLDYGVQFFTTINKKHTLIFGSVFSSNTDLKGTYSELFTRSSNFTGIDTLRNDNKKGTVLLPMRLGIGFTYKYNHKLTVGFDYQTQDWSKAIFFGEKDPLTSASFYRFGLEFVPVPLTEVKRSGYPGRINYRIGGVYEKTNLMLADHQIISYGLTVGLGIPWKNERKLFTSTSFNLTYEFRVRGTLDNSMVKETYNMLTLGLILHDFWFIKPKYD